MCPIPTDSGSNTDQRKWVLEAVEAALRAAEPKLFDAPASPDGPMWVVARHLDALVAIVRRTTTTRIEPYLAEILDDVCTHCERQLPSQFCPLRHENTCALFSHTAVIVQVVAGALKEMEDPEYWFNHPDGSADLAVGRPAR